MITNLDDDLITGIIAKFGPAVKRINLSSNGLRGLGNLDKISPCLDKLNLARNDLMDLRPLLNLTTLTDLDLSENNISDLSPLASLSRLQRLDLSGNKLVSLSALAPLAHHLGALQVLDLQGNPVCKTLGYPHPVLALLPSLQVLDGARTSDYALTLESPSAHPLGAGSAPASPSASPVDAAAAAALSQRLEALERAFELQERALTGSAIEAVRQAAASPGSAAHGAWQSAAAEAGACAGSEEAGQQGHSLALEAFPYLRLLQLWRRKTLESMTQLGLSQSRLQQALSALKESRGQAGQASRAQQLTALAYREKGQADREQAAFLQVRMEELETWRQQDLKYRALVDRERQDAQSRLQGLRSFLEQAQRQVDAEAVQAMLRVSQAARSLRAYEARISQAAERVQLAAALVAQREVVLRNSQAALEAEARTQTLTRRGEREDEGFGGEGSEESGSEDEGEGEVENGALLSELVIPPEAEALLRSVFRRLDDAESGHVPRALLLSFLGVPAEEDAGGGAEVANPNPNRWGGAEVAAEASGIGRSVAEALGFARWGRLARGLRAASGPNVTWGEFLLCLLPQGPRQRGAALSVEELEELRGAGLWGDAEWAAVPLALPKDDRALPSPPVLQAAGVDGSAGSAEVRRLQAERRFLLSRVQAMGRTLERRAEAVKAYFAAALRRARLREGRLQGQASELRTTLEAVERRLREASEAHAGMHRAAQERVAALEEQLADARMQLAARRGEETRALEVSLLEDRARFSRLETEHSLLQRELGKRDVRAKGLSRDVMQLQAQLARAADDKAALEAELRKEREDQGVELHGVKNAWAAERQALEARLADAEARVASISASSSAAADVSAGAERAAAAEPAAGRARRDEFESVRQQMQLLRALPSETGAGATAGQDQLKRTLAAGAAGQSDVYAAHLTKLLRLAEEAISKH